jgi:hypothetical protein
MKKLTVGLAVLLSGYAANSLAALPTGVSTRCDVCVPSYCGGFTFGATGLYWRATSPQRNYAMDYPGRENDFGHLHGSANHHHLHHRYDWGWRANIGYVFPCSGNDIKLTYTNWNRHHRHHHHEGFGIPSDSLPFFLHHGVYPAHFRLAVPQTLVGTALNTVDRMILFSGVLNHVNIPVHPRDIIRIRPHSKFENNTWDLDFGQAVSVGCNFRLRWFGGVRYSRIKHDFRVHTEAAVRGLHLGEPIRRVPFTVAPADTVAPGFPAVGTGTPTTGTVRPYMDVAVNLFDQVRRHSKFDGVGPRLGIDGSYHVGGGFGVVGSLSAALLVGNTRNHFHECMEGGGTITFLPGTAVKLDPALTGPLAGSQFYGEHVTDLPTAPELAGMPVPPLAINPPFGTPIGVVLDQEFNGICFHHPNETRVVPNIDAKLGLDWTYQFCNCSRSKLTIEAGYLVSYFFNPVDRFSALDAMAPQLHNRHNLDVSFDGPYVAVEVKL